MRSLVPGIHAVQQRIALVDHEHGPFDTRFQVGTRDNDGQLEQTLPVRLQPRHLAVQPHEILVGLLQRWWCFFHCGIVAHARARFAFGHKLALALNLQRATPCHEPTP